MTLPDSWETLVVSLSNNSNLTYNGLRGSILNEEIKRADNEEGTKVNVVRGRGDKRNANSRRNKSKSKEEPSTSKGKNDVTCYQCD